MQKGKRYCPNCGTELRPEARILSGMRRKNQI